MTEKTKSAPVPTIRRLPSYLSVLQQLQLSGRDVVSCTTIAAIIKTDPTQVRKDLEWTGIVGRPKTGYKVKPLMDAIETFLGWNNTRDAFLVGAGNLGSAILGYERFKTHGLNIVAAFDIDPRKVGRKIHDKEILPIGKMPYLAARMHIHIGVICVPGEIAQEMADALVAAGIIAIWNFSPVKLNVPEKIIVENVQLANSLAVLTNRLTETIKASDQGDMYAAGI